jgi:hypothetical protein
MDVSHGTRESSSVLSGVENSGAYFFWAGFIAINPAQENHHPMKIPPNEFPTQLFPSQKTPLDEFPPNKPAQR